MKLKRILQSLIFGLALNATPIMAKLPENTVVTPYFLVENSGSTKVGITISEGITRDVSLGIDSSRLYNNRYWENSGGIKYTRNFSTSSLSTSIGISEIKLDDPIYLYENNGDIIHTRDVKAFYLEANFTKQIIKGLNARVTYQRNFARSEVMDNNYPESRVSFGLEGKIEF